MIQLYTTQQVAKMLQVHKCTIQKWVRTGKLSYDCKIANGWRFSAENIEAFRKGNAHAEGG